MASFLVALSGVGGSLDHASPPCSLFCAPLRSRLAHAARLTHTTLAMAAAAATAPEAAARPTSGGTHQPGSHGELLRPTARDDDLGRLGWDGLSVAAIAGRRAEEEAEPEADAEPEEADSGSANGDGGDGGNYADEVRPHARCCMHTGRRRRCGAGHVAWNLIRLRA